MADVLRIKRRLAGGAAGAPASLAAAELAFNEQDNTLYYGKGNSGGNATSIISIAGPGAFQPLDADLTALAALTGTNNIYYRSGANIWSPVTIGSGLTFSGGTLSATASGGNVSNSGTPVAGQIAEWTDATHITGTAKSALTGLPYLPITGGVASGNISVGADSAMMAVYCTPATSGGVAGYNRATGHLRWIMYFYLGTAESGSNSGGDFRLDRYSDTSTYLGSPISINRASGKMTLSSPGGVNISGAQDGSDVPAGYVGEYIAAGPVVLAIPTGGWYGVAAITITPGDWDISAAVQFDYTDATLWVLIYSAIVETVGAAGPKDGMTLTGHYTGSSQSVTVKTGPMRVSTAVSKIMYVAALTNYAGGTCNATAVIHARRAR